MDLDDDAQNAQRRPVSREEQQHNAFGGRKWGAAFFGWLCAIGVTVLLLAIASAAGAAFGIAKGSTSQAKQNAETIGIVGAAVLLVILALGYYAGGYVAGRMARFDGARQGVTVWLIGLLVTVLLAVAGVVFGSKYNVLGQLNLPHIPVDEGAATNGGIIALVMVLVITLLAAIAGGKVGDRYHRKIDRVGAEF
jgi:amino acid transporter